ncbi:DNA-binding transcriptional MerR regulator [Sulfitobacter undariae]|uniref:DNA-binding transcriptional MerR regulator n=1 Tax=Sulfitobacter undariae TaxID=1563671 RepID=A0A7W6H0Z7_9RHOB|nr:helix-turn-helix domain-containing protein [Sulfitobacter undariae]MBB3995446.1 DNA-binding transcriptional MerR regulator [Sulfitobacter undariae]
MLAIGTLSKKTGTKVQTIRYYEQIGLMNEAGRTAGGQRRYFEKDLDRLAFIRHSRQLGFSLESIRELLDLADRPGQSCADADSIAQRQLVQVEQRIKRLQALKKELKRMVVDCNGESVAHCKVLEILRDHDECLTDHNAIGS